MVVLFNRKKHVATMFSTREKARKTAVEHRNTTKKCSNVAVVTMAGDWQHSKVLVLRIH